jgi:hypothetical protein
MGNMVNASLIAPLSRFYSLSALSTLLFFSRIPAALIVYDNPSTLIFPPQHNKPKPKK